MTDVNKTSKTGKETFQWSTPVDEFAEDVDSDEGDVEGTPKTASKKVDDEGSISPYDEDNEDNEPANDEADDPDYQDEDDDNDGEIIINLGVDEANKYAVSRSPKKEKGESTEDIKKWLDEELAGDADKKQTTKKYESRQKFPCPKCPKVWNWPWELRRHLMTHFKEKERQETATYKCEECGKGFQWKRDLAQHRRLHTGEKLLVCSVCEKKFTTRQALLHHVVVHTGEKPFQCALCGNKFTQPANLRTHMKKKHGGESIKGNKCPHCQESFQSVIAIHQHILDDHQSVVAQEREEQALAKLRREQEKAEKERLKMERRRIREEKMSKIPLQDRKSNKRLREYEIDYEFHLGDGLVRGVDWDRTPSNGELNCDVCDRKFGWRYEVMFHGLCHLTDEDGNAKNKVCPECDTAFKVPIGLKHHLLLHTGELPFLCLHCWRSFSSHIDLKLHIRKEHLVHLDESQQQQIAGEPSKKASPMKVKIEPKKQQGPPAKKLKMEASGSVEQQSGEGEDDEQMTTVMVQGDSGDLEGIEGTQTIVLGGDNTIVNTGNQDMIVVIQGDAAEFDQSQGQLIVVDPSQMQQMQLASAESFTMQQATTQSSQQQETMIVGDVAQEATGASDMIAVTESGGTGSTTRYINISELQQMTNNGQTTFMVATSTGETMPAQLSDGNIVVMQQAAPVETKPTMKDGHVVIETTEDKAE